MATNPRDLPLPLTFRERLVRRIGATLLAGECCSLIGAGGVGKTNLARFLLRDDVRAAYLGGADTLVALVDSNALAASGRPDEHGLLELIIHRLIRAAERRGLPEPLVAGMDRLHSSLLAQPDTVLALRYLERICGRLCDEQGLRVVLIFDQFEELWRGLDARLFLNLRYLRDEYKYRLLYLTITRERLRPLRQRSREDSAAVEGFWEMFEPHTLGLGMYDEADARWMLARIAARRGEELDETLAQAALRASGGHPALLRSVYWKLAAGAADADDELSVLPEVELECAKLWEDLSPEAQGVARRLAAGMDLRPQEDAEPLADLRTAEIVQGDPLALFAPLFASYVRRRAGLSSEGVVIDRRQRRVWVDGRLLSSPLTPLEFGLLAHLAERAGEVCPREGILAALYPEESLDANDDRIDTLLRRLRDSLGDDGRNPRHLITHRGIGVRLACGRIEG